MQGAEAVAEALADELGIEIGQTTEDGLFSLDWTSCIGMSDQAPAALVNEVVVTKLTPDGARQMIRKLRRHEDPRQLVEEFGDGNNAHRAGPCDGREQHPMRVASIRSCSDRSIVARQFSRRWA